MFSSSNDGLLFRSKKKTTEIAGLDGSKIVLHGEENVRFGQRTGSLFSREMWGPENDPNRSHKYEAWGSGNLKPDVPPPDGKGPTPPTQPHGPTPRETVLRPEFSQRENSDGASPPSADDKRKKPDDGKPKTSDDNKTKKSDDNKTKKSDDNKSKKSDDGNLKTPDDEKAKKPNVDEPFPSRRPGMNKKSEPDPPKPKPEL